MIKRLKYVLVDDNEAYRKALRDLLLTQFDADILAEAANAEDVLKIENISRADIILMDVMMPLKNGIELTKELLWFKDSKLKIIAITMHTDRVYLKELLETGFKGCIFKNDIAKQLEKAIEKVMNGKLFFPNDILLDDYNQKQID